MYAIEKEKKKRKKTAQHPVRDHKFPFQIGCCKTSGLLGEANFQIFLLKYRVNTAHAQNSMGSRDGKHASCAYELPGASHVSFIYFVQLPTLAAPLKITFAPPQQWHIYIGLNHHYLLPTQPACVQPNIFSSPRLQNSSCSQQLSIESD